MNILCKKTLQKFKGVGNENLNRLIDSIVRFEGAIDSLTLENLSVEAQPVMEQTPQGSVGQETGVRNDESMDLRIKSLAFRDFRTFPSQECPYGIDFTKSTGAPCSLFLVGKNGTGKSTIFDALEWLYSGKVSNAIERGVNDNDKLYNYLTYGFGRIEGKTSDGVRLKVILNKRGVAETNWQSIKAMRPISVPALCCSDMDIEEIAKLDEETGGYDEDDLQKYVRRQLGYEELRQLKSKLLDILQDTTEQTRRIVERINLAELDAHDINRIKSVFVALVEKGHIKITPRLRGILRFADRKDIEAIVHSENPQEELGTDNWEFRDYWEKLLQNEKHRRQQVQGHKGEGGFMNIQPQNAEDTNEDHLQGQINGMIDQLVAIYGRLKKACDGYLSNENGDGLASELDKFRKDYELLVSLEPIVPTKKTEIERFLVPKRAKVSVIPSLVHKIEDFLGKLFQDQVVDGNGNITYENKYPSNLRLFVANVLNHYREPGETFKVELTANSFEVKIEVQDDKGEAYTTTPGAYFNTFRFRLYAVLLKIALAFYYMKENQCVAPVIIDDVFNASDFENSVSLNTFIFTIYDVYQELLGGEYPLQLIILTHDEMIASAFRQGVMMRSPKMMERIRENRIAAPDKFCIFGRLFHYKEAAEVNKVSNIKRDFLNLYLQTNI